jgi:ABC-type multidrug transport system fused ATPase/permease subunit
MLLLQHYTRLLATYFRPQRGRVALLAFLILGGIGLQLLNPQLIRYVLDTAEAGGALRALILAAVLFILFGLLQAAATFAATYVGEDVSWTATNALRADLALHCLHLDMRFHNARTPGELIERIDGDVSQLADFFSQLVLNVLANGLLVLGVIVLLGVEDWRLGTAALFYALLVLVTLQAVQGRTVRLWSAARGTGAALYGFIEERMAGREDVRANGGVAYVLRRLAQLQRATYEAHYHARIFGIFTYGLTHLLAVTARVLALGIGIWLYFNGSVTIGAVFLIIYYVGLLQEPLEKLRTEIEALQQATASIDRINALLAEQPQAAARSAVHANGIAPTGLPTGPVAVTFDRVSFHYADNDAPLARIEAVADAGVAVPNKRPPTVLQGISFHLPAGQVLGLLGRTGSGKTTLTRLLFQLYQPQQGEICLNDISLTALDRATIRRTIGMVTQEVQLFQATLRDNLTFFDPTVKDRQILAVIEELGLGRWFAAQPQGLDTVLTGGGSGLSAGEAQLLAFVRVFLKDPQLVILDEASSRLDPATEQLLERAIDRLLANRTGIIIAHRLATVQRADRILLLDRGRVAEFGERVALAADPTSHFAQLLRHGLPTAGQPAPDLQEVLA